MVPKKLIGIRLPGHHTEKQTNKNNNKKEKHTTSWREREEWEEPFGLATCAPRPPCQTCPARAKWPPPDDPAGLWHQPRGPSSGACVPSGHFLTTHTDQQLQRRGQSITRQALVPERRKECHPSSMNRCRYSPSLPWKLHSLKYELLCQGRCTI